jgi:hypothetical protein
MAAILPALLALSLLTAAPAALGEPATARYAPAQLRVAQDLLERARAAAALGEVGRAGKLAWQATLDARLAWGMSESPQMRAEAAAIGGAASALIARLAARERR